MPEVFSKRRMDVLYTLFDAPRPQLSSSHQYTMFFSTRKNAVMKGEVWVISENFRQKVHLTLKIVPKTPLQRATLSSFECQKTIFLRVVWMYYPRHSMRLGLCCRTHISMNYLLSKRKNIGLKREALLTFLPKSDVVVNKCPQNVSQKSEYLVFRAPEKIF